MRICFRLLACSLFLGTTFAQSGFQTQSISLPHDHFSILSADLNQDGKPDLVLSGGTPVEVMLNNGDGTFAAPVVIDTELFLATVQSADFNNDGIPDLVACGTDRGEVPHLIIYLNDGTGTFTRSETLNFDCRKGLAVGDMDGDGNQDVISGPVNILFGDGTGHLPRATSQTVNVNPTQHPEITGCFASGLVSADFIGDGHMHLLITGVCNNPPGLNTSTYGTLYFGQNDGAGNFTFSEVFEAEVTWEFVGNAVDVDQNGLPDVMMKHRLSRINPGQFLEAMDIAFNQGGGNFQVVDMFNLDITNSTNSNSGVYSGASADFDLDSRPDVVVAYTTSSGNFMAMVDADGTNNWTITDVWNPGDRVLSVISADFNGDGLPDIAAITNNFSSSRLLIYLRE
jgi:hypothetical protein